MGNKLIKCPKCGKQNDASIETCESCGINLQWALEHWDHYVSGPEEGCPPLILVSDDDPAVMHLIRFVLERVGYRVAIVTTSDYGGYALETLALAEHLLPDLITTNISMLGMDGIEIIHRLKSNPVLRDTPVLVISARCQEEIVNLVMKTGATKCLCHPVSPRDLISAVTSILDN